MKRIGKKDKNKEKLRSKQRQSRREKERELPDVSLSRSGERLSSRKNLPVTGGGARYLNAALSRTENLPGAKFSHIPLFPGSKCTLYVLTLRGLVFFFFNYKVLSLYSPGMQTHRKVPGSSRQEPSFWHGWDSHSFTFVSHLGPVKPWVQLQAKEPGVLTQIPSCSHGEPGIENQFFFVINNSISSFENFNDCILLNNLISWIFIQKF